MLPCRCRGCKANGEIWRWCKSREHRYGQSVVKKNQLLILWTFTWSESVGGKMSQEKNLPEGLPTSSSHHSKTGILGRSFDCLWGSHEASFGRVTIAELTFWKGQVHANHQVETVLVQSGCRFWWYLFSLQSLVCISCKPWHDKITHCSHGFRKGAHSAWDARFKLSRSDHTSLEGRSGSDLEILPKAVFVNNCSHLTLWCPLRY